MANILWPEELCPSTFSLPLRVDMRSHSATFGGSERVIDLLDDVWMAELTIDTRQGVAAGRLEGLVNWLNGGRDTASLWHFARPVPNGTLRGTPSLAASVSKGAGVLTIASVAGATLLPGDMLGVGGLLLQCAEPATADEFGAISVPLVNRLRAPLATGLPVVWDKPTAQFRLQSLSSLGHGTTYSDAVTMSFEENIYG